MNRLDLQDHHRLVHWLSFGSALSIVKQLLVSNVFLIGICYLKIQDGLHIITFKSRLQTKIYFQKPLTEQFFLRCFYVDLSFM